MRVLLYLRAVLPVRNYGGTERVVWDLGYALKQRGHDVVFLALPGTECDWAEVITYQQGVPLDEQIPADIDVVHFHSSFEPISKPYVTTQHGNSDNTPDINTIFVSAQHAKHHGATAFVHNGLNWDNYLQPDLGASRERFHFLGKAAWRVKNVQGAIDITRQAGEQLDVLGGHRFNFKMGLRLTFDRHVAFHGMVDDVAKSQMMSRSKGLIFPVTWHEPFGLAITESLYFGCPVFATPYGSLPELVTADVGVLSSSQAELVDAVKRSTDFSAQRCHEYARAHFNADVMAQAYVDYYQQAIRKEPLNPRLTAANTQFKHLPYQR